MLVAPAATLSLPVTADSGVQCAPGQVMLQAQQAVPGGACAEVASTDASREHGLMFRTHLGTDQGMLFVFPRSDLYRMWMKNTLIPLSVAFIDEQGTIVNVDDMAPATLTPHGAVEPARYALEMTLGWFDQHHWTPGQRVLGLPSPAPAR